MTNTPSTENSFKSLEDFLECVAFMQLSKTPGIWQHGPYRFVIGRRAPYRYEGMFFEKSMNAGWLLHHDDGPAVVLSDGHTEYWVDGELHRFDGPAIITPWGAEEYWENDVHLQTILKSGRVMQCGDLQPYQCASIVNH